MIIGPAVVGPAVVGLVDRAGAVVAGVLAQTQNPAPPPGDPAAGRGEEFGKTSPLALVVILLLALATILLIRSMNKRLRNVPASFDSPDDTGSTGEASEEASGAEGELDEGDSTHSATSTSDVRRTDGPSGAGSP